MAKPSPRRSAALHCRPRRRLRVVLGICAGLLASGAAWSGPAPMAFATAGGAGGAVAGPTHAAPTRARVFPASDEDATTEAHCPYQGTLYPPGTRLGDLVCRDGAWVPA
ncbi:MAG: hypothetical protein ACXIUV_03990 [Alkalilacustris sp.]